MKVKWEFIDSEEEESQACKCLANKPTNLRMSFALGVIKLLSTRWMISTCEYIKGEPEFMKNGFKEA